MSGLRMKYCYWSVARGAAERAALERCVNTARQAGVFKEFHVLTDAPIDGCECYDAQNLDAEHGLRQLIYLKAGMAKLLFDHFVWVEPSTVFASNPSDVIGALSRAPLHVPLEVEISKVEPLKEVRGITAEQYRATMTKCGALNPVYLSGSAFWIVQHDAIDVVCDWAMQAWHKAKEMGPTLDVSFALGYAMQMLCGNPARHTVAARPDLWAADYKGQFSETLPGAVSWEFEDLTGTERFSVNPAIVWLARQPSALGDGPR